MSLAANLASKINNNQLKYKHYLRFPASKVLIEIVKVLFKENLIRGFFIEKNENKTYVYLLLKYGTCKKPFQKVSAISKLTSNQKSFQVVKYQNGLGLHIFSTSKGFLTNYEAAKLKLGGKLIIKIS
uniref:Ribosomal protein S8 n=1 Tax=Chroomonas placoidea TaxID=173977 RepID=A0A2P1G817_9CRYP|nr:ribosomal protein S8 [Chroomonas placoidea]AVM81108.1 ribosomal protein S8 [Chroomonas placoidea]